MLPIIQHARQLLALTPHAELRRDTQLLLFFFFLTNCPRPTPTRALFCHTEGAHNITNFLAETKTHWQCKFRASSIWQRGCEKCFLHENRETPFFEFPKQSLTMMKFLTSGANAQTTVHVEHVQLLWALKCEHNKTTKQLSMHELGHAPPFMESRTSCQLVLSSNRNKFKQAQVPFANGANPAPSTQNAIYQQCQTPTRKDRFVNACCVWPWCVCPC